MLSAALPFAHAGHWITSLIYLAPVVLVAAFVVLHARARRGDADVELEIAPDR